MKFDSRLNLLKPQYIIYYEVYYSLYPPDQKFQRIPDLKINDFRDTKLPKVRFLTFYIYASKHTKSDLRSIRVTSTCKHGCECDDSIGKCVDFDNQPFFITNKQHN